MQPIKIRHFQDRHFMHDNRRYRIITQTHENKRTHSHTSKRTQTNSTKTLLST